VVEIRRGREEGRERTLEEDEEITEENVFDRYDEPQGFFPNQVIADLTVSAILLAMIVVLSYWIPAPLTEPAEISTTVYVPRPEWFFFFLDQWLVYFPGSALIAIGDVIIPGLFALLLLAVPWLDKEPAHSPMRRPFMVVISLLVITTIVLNMILAMIRIANFPGGTPPG
jgi:menaquinol-cytochrome c reductase cytochrome b/c subunit